MYNYILCICLSKEGNYLNNVLFLGLPWTVYEIALYFIIYAVIGWLIEVSYMTVELGEFENRGFLNGPLCPIYGFGTVIIIITLTPLIDNLLFLFIGSIALCTSLELIVGFGLEKIFHNTWWDYSHEKFNFHGYICLKISLLWGMGCIIVLRVVHPLIVKLVNIIPLLLGQIIIYSVFAFIAFDLIISLCVVNKLNLRLKEIDEISKKLRIASDAIGGNLSDEVLELKAKYNKLIAQRKHAQERIIKAFPDMKSINYSRALEAIKQKVNIKKSNDKQ